MPPMKENPVVGEIRAFACSGKDMLEVLAVSGWLLCNGQVYQDAKYPLLARRLAMPADQPGKIWGVDETNVATTFRVPDLRGLFVRGWAPLKPGEQVGVETVRDPNVSGRSPLYPPTGASGYAVGSYQPDEWKSHRHDLMTQRFPFSSQQGGQTYLGHSAANLHQDHTSVDGGEETRPRNVYLLYAIYSGVGTN
jgi:hypothetical protein